MSFLWGYVNAWMNPGQQETQVPAPPPPPENETPPEQAQQPIQPIKQEPIQYFTMKGMVVLCFT